jgi:1,2-phenylacetyl-CoA epoxidase catalytic subunit
MINTPIDSAAAALATAAASPITATGEETLTLVRDLARIAHHLGELTAAVRDRWADWGTVTPHLQRAEALAADTTRCLSHAASTYAFNTTLEVGCARPRPIKC